MSSVIEKVKVQPKVGDILYSSWGYDQTNIEFFKVVKVSEFSVWIQEVGAARLSRLLAGRTKR
jgi:hypothetical protein